LAAPKGNDFNVKWKTPEERQAACDAFCAHIAEGYSMDSFPDASAKTIRSYAKAYPEDFPAEKLERAARESLLVWERLGMQGAKGEIAGFNATSWIFNMKNRAGWRDKIEATTPPGDGGGDAPKSGKTVKARPTGEIALSMMALLAKAEYERGDEDADVLGEAGKPD
jgi:hypothetical protein